MSKQKSAVETTGKVEDKQGYVEVSRVDVLGGIEQDNKRDVKKIKIRPFVTQTATVSVKKGITIPTEPYAGVRLDVMISCPCYMEEIVDVYGQVSELADNLLDREIAVVNGETPADLPKQQTKEPVATKQPTKVIKPKETPEDKQDATSGDLGDNALADIPIGEPDVDDLLSGTPVTQSQVNNDGGDDIIDELLG